LLINWTTSTIERQSCGGIFDFDAKQTRLNELTRLTEDPAIWDDNKRAQELGREKKMLEDVVLTLESLGRQLHDAGDLFQMAKEEDDDATLESVGTDIAQLEKIVARLEFRRMFSNAMDPNNCFVDIQAGSGGTEAQDWAECWNACIFATASAAAMAWRSWKNRRGK
jgi:peptide chain release factor 2